MSQSEAGGAVGSGQSCRLGLCSAAWLTATSGMTKRLLCLQCAVWETCLTVEHCSFYIVDPKTEAHAPCIEVVGAYCTAAVTLMERWYQKINVRCFVVIAFVSSTSAMNQVSVPLRRAESILSGSVAPDQSFAQHLSISWGGGGLTPPTP